MLPQFGTDGLRGKANTEITQRVSYALGVALTQTYGPQTFVVGTDTRQSGPSLTAALVAGLISGGGTPETLGVVTTPAVAWASASQNCPGVMISASHNPYYDNGLKVFGPGGHKLSDLEQNKIAELLAVSFEASPETSDYAISPKLTDTELVAGWEASVISSVPSEVSLEGLKLVLDCANGSAFESAPRIFSKLGLSVNVIGANPDGTNINQGCGSTDISSLQRKVVAEKADLGIAFDGDADRLIAVDERGREVNGDTVLAVLAADLKERGLLMNDTLVVTVMSNLGLHKSMEAKGIKVLTTQVGDRYVLEALNEGDLSLGGEQSGHVICRDLSTTGDGVLTGVQLVSALVRSGLEMSELADSAMVEFPQVLTNVKLPQRVSEVPTAISERVELVEAELGEDGRVLVRPSGTEPLIRVMVEHKDEATAARVASDLAEFVASQG